MKLLKTQFKWYPGMLYIGLVILGIIRYQFLTVISTMFSAEFSVLGDLKKLWICIRNQGESLWPLSFAFLHNLQEASVTKWLFNSKLREISWKRARRCITKAVCCVLQLCSALAGLSVVICLDVSILFFSSDRMPLISAVPCWKMKSFLAPMWFIIIQARAVRVLKIMFGLHYVKIS